MLYQLYVEFLWLENVSAIFGSWVIFFIGCYGYMADTTSPESRYIRVCISAVFTYFVLHLFQSNLGFNGFSVFQDDPYCDHGRMLLCDGHHWELHERADLQKVNIALFQKDTFVTHCHSHNSPSSSPPSSLTFRFNSCGSSFVLIMITSIIIMTFMTIDH